MQHRNSDTTGSGKGAAQGLAPASGANPEARLLHWRPAEPGPRESRYAAAFARARDQALGHHRKIAAARAAAQAAARQLLAEPAERREMLLHNHPRFGATHCGGWRLASVLVDEVEGGSWGTPGQTPHEPPHETLAERTRLAELASGLVPEGSPDADDADGPLAADTAARVWRVLGDLQRRGGDLDAAGLSLARARRHLRRGSGDPLERAALLEASGRLLSARGRRRAWACLAGAAKLYTQLAETDGEARCRVSLALHVLGSGPQPPGAPSEPHSPSPGEIREAVDELLFGLDLLDPDAEPELFEAALRRLRQVWPRPGMEDGPRLAAPITPPAPPVTGYNELA